MTKAVDIKRDQFWNKSFISVPSLKSLIGKNLTYNENVAMISKRIYSQNTAYNSKSFFV